MIAETIFGIYNVLCCREKSLHLDANGEVSNPGEAEYHLIVQDEQSKESNTTQTRCVIVHKLFALSIACMDTSLVAAISLTQATN